MDGLTDKQKEVLDYVIGFVEENGYPPTYREIGVALDIKYTKGVGDHLRALEKKGYLAIDEGGAARALAVLRDSTGMEVSCKFGEAERRVLKKDCVCPWCKMNFDPEMLITGAGR